MKSPVRFYLALLFIAVIGVGAYMILQSQNDDYTATQALNNQNLKSTPAPTASPSAAATSPVSEATPATNATAINTTTEANAFDTVLSSMSDSDYDSSSLTDTNLGI